MSNLQLAILVAAIGFGGGMIVLAITNAADRIIDSLERLTLIGTISAKDTDDEDESWKSLN